jgi:hypothetical protein
LSFEIQIQFCRPHIKNLDGRPALVAGVHVLLRATKLDAEDIVASAARGAGILIQTDLARPEYRRAEEKPKGYPSSALTPACTSLDGQSQTTVPQVDVVQVDALELLLPKHNAIALRCRDPDQSEYQRTLQDFPEQNGNYPRG